MDNKLQSERYDCEKLNKVSNRQGISFPNLRNIPYLNNTYLLNKAVENRIYRPTDIYCIMYIFEKAIQDGELVLHMKTI